MQRMLAVHLVLAWSWTLVVSAVGLSLISEAILGTCRKGSTLRILSRSWSVKLAFESSSFAGAHFGSILLEFLAGVVGPWTWFWVFLPAGVLGAHGEGGDVLVDSVSGDVVVAGTGLKSVAEGIGLSLCADCDLWAGTTTA